MEAWNYNAEFVMQQRDALHMVFAEACGDDEEKFKELLPRLRKAVDNLLLQGKVLSSALNELSREYADLFNGGDGRCFISRGLARIDGATPGIIVLRRSEAFFAQFLYERKLSGQSLWDLVEGK